VPEADDSDPQFDHFFSSSSHVGKRKKQEENKHEMKLFFKVVDALGASSLLPKVAQCGETR